MHEVSTPLPHVSVAQMIEVDRAMVEDFGIDLPRMMENAGRCLAALTRTRFFAGDLSNSKVLVLAGPGGNGGGALVCARHLHNWGAKVGVILARPSGSLSKVTQEQLEILRKMQIPVAASVTTRDKQQASLIIDGLLGYSLVGKPRGEAADLIRCANDMSQPILSLDLPSGLGADSGDALEPTIRATATMTLALPKIGLANPSATQFVGELYLADIGVPYRLYQQAPLALNVPIPFSKGEIVRLT